MPQIVSLCDLCDLCDLHLLSPLVVTLDHELLRDSHRAPGQPQPGARPEYSDDAHCDSLLQK